MENPEKHSYSVHALIQGDGTAFQDSVELFDDGLHGDGVAADNLYGGSKALSVSDEAIYGVTLRTTDLESDITTLNYFSSYFTTIGPVVLDNFTYESSDTIPNPGDRLDIYLTLKNNGSIETVINIKASLVSLDPFLDAKYNRTFDDIAAGEKVTSKSKYRITISKDCPENSNISE
ncbi:hypothetical protein JW935_14275 [candidate division KSB1 bacterium]|nr:hypothetical protein [candidate division KSB1 bacterium]